MAPKDQIVTFQAGTKRQKKPNKLVATLSDIFVTTDFSETPRKKSGLKSLSWKIGKKEKVVRDPNNVSVARWLLLSSDLKGPLCFT